LFYQTYDATALVESGKNAIGVILADGWCCGHIGMSGSSCQYGDTHALLLQMEIEYADGSKDIVTSDEGFKFSDSGPYVYSDLFIGERYDARNEMPNFSKAELDTKSWKSVHFANESMDCLHAFYGEPVRRVKEIPATEVIITPKGEIVIDFGQNIAGRVKMRVRGERGMEVTLEHSEMLDDKGNFLINIVGINKNQKDVYVMKGEGEEIYEPAFTYHGFRYVRLTGFQSKPDKSDFTAVVIASDLANTGSFSTSNKDINQLQSNIYWSQLGNLVSIPTDCPQREKAGWTGDIQVYAPTAAFNQDVYSFLKRWLQSLRADQYEDGNVPFLSPFIKSYKDDVAAMFKMISAAGWSDACVIVPFDLYKRYGDDSILRENYDTMKKYMSFVNRKIISGEWFKQFHYGDWMIPSITTGLMSSMKGARLTKEFVATAYYARTTDLMSQIATILGKDTDVESYNKSNAEIKAAFKQKYIDTAVNGKFSVDYQGMYILALQFDLIPEEIKPKFISRLGELIKSNDYRLDTGFLSVPFIMDVLVDNGLEDLAQKLIFQDKCPSWLYEVKCGATTMWESWGSIAPDGKRRNLSYNHYAFGCVGDWMYRRIAGIQPLEVGYRKIQFSPLFNLGFTSASAEYASVYGKIVSKWRTEHNALKVEVEVPCNTTGIVKLDGIKSMLKGDAEGVIVNGKMTVNVGSGRYGFEFAI
jgi:alpha-L-rhamnosidase